MKVSMLKLVTLASAASATQAALLCTTDKFCATADSSKPHCIYTSATASECKAALLATTTACFKSSTADLLQCVATDFCDYSNTTPADRKCKTKILKTVAAVGTANAEKFASCKSGEVDSAGKCNPASDAGCTAEAGSAQYYVKTGASTFACGAAATLLANGAACFQASTKGAIQCVATDFCDFSNTDAAQRICKTKILKTVAAAGTNDAMKAASCKSGRVDSAGKCNPASDAECTAEAGSAEYYVKTGASTFACGAVGTLLANDAACFQASTTDAIQCVASDQCIAQDGTTFKCKTKATNDATCSTISSTTLPFFVKASATTASTCAAGLALDAACFMITTTTANQCATGHYCPATSDAADNKCKARLATGATCVTATFSGVDCLSGTCTSDVCVGKAVGATCTVTGECLATSYCDTTCKLKIAKDKSCAADEACATGYCGVSGNGMKKCADSTAPTASTNAPTTVTTAPSKAPTKADHSDASAITASAFVVASTVIASSVFA